MEFSSVFESIVSQIGTLSRQEIIEHILHFDGHLKLDFTESYLDSLNDDQLRHILMAAFFTEGRRLPV